MSQGNLRIPRMVALGNLPAMISAQGKHQQAQALVKNFMQSGNIGDLDKAIDLQRQAILHVPDNNAHKHRLLGQLGNMHLERFRLLTSPPDLNESITSYVQSLSLIRGPYAGLSSLLDNLSKAYVHRFDHTANPQDLDQAINTHSHYISLLGTQTPPALELTKLGHLFLLRFSLKQNAADIQNAIVLYTSAQTSMPDSSSQKTKTLNDLATMHLQRFNLLGLRSDIDHAIKFAHQSVRLTPPEDSNLPRRLCCLGSHYYRRFESYGVPEDIEKAIEFHSQALSSDSVNDTDQCEILSNLGVAYRCRFERLGNMEDIQEAISWLTAAALAIGDDDSQRPSVLRHLGSAWMRQFLRTGNTSDIDEAIDSLKEAALLVPDSDSDMPRCLHDLGTSYTCRFNQLGDPSDINEAVECLHKAVSVTLDGHMEQANRLNDLANAYYRRFDNLGTIEDINEAIAWQSASETLTPDDHANKTLKLGNLGSMFQSRFKRLGEISDIDEAIEFHNRSLSLFPDDHVEKSRISKRLGISYIFRFDRLGDPADIDKAIHFHNQALLLTPHDDVDRADQLNGLGAAYSARFGHFGRTTDIGEATNWLQMAVDLTPNDHVEKPSRLTNLCNAYNRRFLLSQDTSDIDNAVIYGKQAVLLTPDAHIGKPKWLINLGRTYMARFSHLGKSEDLDRSVECNKMAAALAPDNSPHKSTALATLGDSYLARFNQSSAPQDAESAVECMREAALSPTGDLRARFHACVQWANCLATLPGQESPIPAYQRAMELVPQLVWVGSTIDQRYRLITQIGDVAMEAAAHAIALGAYDSALEWLEEGRSIVWNQILQLRTPFNQLAEVDLALATQLEEIGRELDQAGSRSSLEPESLLMGGGSDLGEDSKRHHDLASQWDKLLQEARRIPGFETFLQPRTANELKDAAKDGPVVVINMHSTRCDALVLQPNVDTVGHVPLSNFSRKKAVEIRAHIDPLAGRNSENSDTRYIKRLQPQPQQSFTGMLTILWLDVVKPVLDFLGYKQKLPVDELPHIHWCTTGTLSFLPLHAAGPYDGSQLNLFDLAVSSYTPTLGALLAAKPLASRSSHSGILAVGQENTKGLTPLPCTALELSRIGEQARATRYLQLKDADATVATVLDQMASHNWVHLACHATQDASDPAQSAFHLHDGNLTLSAITKQAFKNKGLAFLSACQTATGSTALPDEAVHLAAALLMAGYSTVIATMWSIHDEDAPEVAQDVYRDLLKHGNMDHRGAARALHKAVENLRYKVDETSFERWVPFVHVGI